MDTAHHRDDPARLRVLAGVDADNIGLRIRLDAITERTARRLGRPVSLVTLVDDRRQIFPGSYGLTGRLLEIGETPVEWSFCAEMIDSREPYVVPDATLDPVQRTNPLVVSQGFRSYAGVPLVVGGEVIGAHCVLDTTAHDFTASDMAELAAAAEEIAMLLEQYR